MLGLPSFGVMACITYGLLFGAAVFLAIMIMEALSFLRLIKRPSLLEGIPYMTGGSDLIMNAYKTAKGTSFAVQTPSNQHVFVWSPLHIRELDLYSSKDLSLHAAAKEILQPRYTYTDHQYEWPDQRGEDSIGFNRALRSLLTSNLPRLLPMLHQTLARELDAKVAAADKAESGCSKLPVLLNIRSVFTTMSSVIFFGEDFVVLHNWRKSTITPNSGAGMSIAEAETDSAKVKDPEVTKNLERYMFLIPIVAEVIKLLPAFCAQPVAKLLTSNHKQYRAIHQALAPMVEERLRLRAVDEEPAEKPIDGLQWLIDTSPKHKNQWSVTRTIDEVIAVWFSSVPQLSHVCSFALHDLAVHPEWQAKLLTELRSGEYESFLSTAKGLPMLEAFIKESTRLTPIDAVACRRKVLRTVEFTNGPKVEAGDWVSVPQQAMWRDGQTYTDADKFDPMRWLKLEVHTEGKGAQDELTSELTQVSTKWVLWGFGRTACPGRFFATFSMKLLLSHVLLNYEIQPQMPSKRHFIFRSVNVPSDDMSVLLKPL